MEIIFGRLTGDEKKKKTAASESETFQQTLKSYVEDMLQD